MADILVLLQEHYPKDTRVRKEVMALVERGHNLSIICLKDQDEQEIESLNGVTIYRISIKKKRASGLRYVFEYFSFFFLAYLKVRRLTKERKFDIVHVHTIPDFLVYAANPAKKRGAKVILDMHEIMPEFYMSKFGIRGDNMLVKLLRFIERKSIEYADQVITINIILKEKFQSRTEPKAEIVEIMNTVSEDVMPRYPKQLSSKFTAIYHGTLTKLYNLEFAIRAIYKIADELRDFEFHIYGSGPEFINLKNLVSDLSLKDVVFLHGKVAHEKIPQILAQADLGILPIQKDIMSDMSFSNKLAEYVYNEIPVLSSDLRGVMHYFGGDALYYYTSGDVDDFNRKLIRVISDPEERKIFAKRAFEQNVRISWDVMKIRLQQTIESVLTR